MAAYRRRNYLINQTEENEWNNRSSFQRYVDTLRFSGLIKDIPDIRKHKVDRIKRLIKSGEYHISSTQVAGRMIKIHKDLAVL